MKKQHKSESGTNNLIQTYQHREVLLNHLVGSIYHIQYFKLYTRGQWIVAEAGAQEHDKAPKKLEKDGVHLDIYKNILQQE